MPSKSLADGERGGLAEALAAAGRRLDARGLAAATSGNYSARLEDGNVLVTRSGRHKGRLTAEDFMAITPDGAAIDPGKPSDEAALHTLIYRHFPQAGAILHWHGPVMAGLGRAIAPASEYVLRDHEMLKAFPGVTTHDTAIALPIVENSQDMAEIEAAILPALARPGAPPLFLIRSHGVYAWGRDVAEAERVAEAIEWLVAAELAELQWRDRLSRKGLT